MEIVKYAIIPVIKGLSKDMNCSICGQSTILVERYYGAPHCIMGQYNAPQLQLRDLEIYHCNHCGHSLIPAHVNEDYYEEYSMGSYWGASFRKLRAKQIEKLAQLAPKQERFLDIGCGVGHYLALAQAHFSQLVGVEPSLTGVQASREKGFEVIHDYFHEGLSFDDRFDAITIIEVLEHLEQPTVFLRQVANLLHDDGVLLVEVPNGQRIMEQQLFYNLCTDHIQYFSVTSLVELARQAGLTVIAVQQSEDPNLLELYARKVKQRPLNFTAKRQRALDQLLAQISSDQRIAAWGAGAESICFLAMLQHRIPLACLFDSDLAKHGHTLATIPIMQPTTERVNAYDYIILFANAHHQQISAQLNEMGFNGKLLTFQLIK